MKERKLSTAASPVNLETIFFFAIDGTYIKSLVSSDFCFSNVYAQSEVCSDFN